jgi:hypothetical protein
VLAAAAEQADLNTIELPITLTLLSRAPALQMVGWLLLLLFLLLPTCAANTRQTAAVIPASL